jgi:hypothetical protein
LGRGAIGRPVRGAVGQRLLGDGLRDFANVVEGELFADDGAPAVGAEMNRHMFVVLLVKLPVKPGPCTLSGCTVSLIVATPRRSTKRQPLSIAYESTHCSVNLLRVTPSSAV